MNRTHNCRLLRLYWRYLLSRKRLIISWKTTYLEYSYIHPIYFYDLESYLYQYVIFIRFSCCITEKFGNMYDYVVVFDIWKPFGYIPGDCSAHRIIPDNFLMEGKHPPINIRFIFFQAKNNRFVECHFTMQDYCIKKNTQTEKTF